MAADIPVRIILDAIDNASNTLKNVAGEMETFGSTARKAGVGMAALGAATVYFAKSVIEQAGAMEQNRIAFETMLGSAKKARDLLAQMSDFAQRTPFNLPEIVDAGKQLLAYGFAQKEVIKTTEMLGNVASGLSIPLGDIIYLFGTLRAQGRAYTKDLNQFTARGIPILDSLAKQYHVTTSEVFKLAETGRIGFKDIEKAFEGMTGKGGQFFDLMDKQSKSTMGVWSNLQDSITRVQIALGNALLPTANEVMKAIMPLITQFGEWAKVNQDLVKKITFVGLAIGAVGTTLLALGIIIPPIIASISLLGYVFTATFGILAIALAAASIGIYAFSKNFASNIDYIQGKLQPFEDAFKYMRDRIMQILNSIGISGEFGGIINFFQNTSERATFWTERIIQIILEYKNKLQNILAFGQDVGDASWVDAFIGVWNRLKPLVASMSPIFDDIKIQLATSAAIVQTQIIPAWNAFLEVLKPFINAVWPLIKDALLQFVQGTIMVTGAIIALGAAIFTGLIMAITNALPYILQAVEGIIQFFRGLIEFFTGVFTGDWALAWEGIKQTVKGAYDFISNMVMAIEKAIDGFVKGVINIFMALYNALIGHSIIPDLVNGIIEWFIKLVTQTYNIITSLPRFVIDAFNTAKNSAIDIAREMYDGVKVWFEKVIGFFRDIINWASQAIGKANEAASAGFKAGKRQFGGPVSAFSPVMVGEAGPEMFIPQTAGRVVPAHETSKGGGGTTIQFIINSDMIINSPTERRGIAEALYKDLVMLARSQDMTVAQMLGG